MGSSSSAMSSTVWDHANRYTVGANKTQYPHNVPTTPAHIVPALLPHIVPTTPTMMISIICVQEKCPSDEESPSLGEDLGKDYVDSYGRKKRDLPDMPKVIEKKLSHEIVVLGSAETGKSRIKTVGQ